MTHIRLKLLVGGLIFAVALAYLAFAGAKKGLVYTVAVDAYLASPEYQTQRVRLCGQVATDGVSVNAGERLATFNLNGHSQQIPVSYHGLVPDLFKPGCEVLVEGKRDPAGVFQANVMMTKCASKYDEAPKGHPTSRPTADGGMASANTPPLHQETTK